MRPHEASHMLSSTPLVYSLRAPHPISSRTGSVGGALLRLLARLGDPSRASSPLLRSNSLAHSWWVSLHVGWPTLTCECLFTLF